MLTKDEWNKQSGLFRTDWLNFLINFILNFDITILYISFLISLYKEILTLTNFPVFIWCKNISKTGYT